MCRSAAYSPVLGVREELDCARALPEPMLIDAPVAADATKNARRERVAPDSERELLGAWCFTAFSTG